jgi:hypothetical protein
LADIFAEIKRENEGREREARKKIKRLNISNGFFCDILSASRAFS